MSSNSTVRSTPRSARSPGSPTSDISRCATSLKLYLYSYRNANIFHEEAVNSLLDAVVKCCAPRKAEVIGSFRPRGGIAIRVKATYGGDIDEF